MGLLVADRKKEGNIVQPFPKLPKQSQDFFFVEMTRNQINPSTKNNKNTAHVSGDVKVVL